MDKNRLVSADVYDQEYFLMHRGGSIEFSNSNGVQLYDPHKYALKLAGLRYSDRVLDIGCGCGEVALNAGKFARSVLGIDYSKDAIDLAQEAKKKFDIMVQKKVHFLLTDLDQFNFFKNNYFDTVFLLDVIEHLNQDQISRILPQIHECLKIGGRLIVHTWPNRWHRERIYPISYLIGKISGKDRPKDPRKKHEKLMHVSEQSPLELKHNLNIAGFKTSIFLRYNSTQAKSLGEAFYDFLHCGSPFKYFFCDHIWGIGKKVN